MRNDKIHSLFYYPFNKYLVRVFHMLQTVRNSKIYQLWPLEDKNSVEKTTHPVGGKPNVKHPLRDMSISLLERESAFVLVGGGDAEKG